MSLCDDILYLYANDGTSSFWLDTTSQTATGTITYTAANTVPSAPRLGDQWYYIATDVLYTYSNDGTTSFWLDISSPSVR
jgi:hypothetical protein